MDYYTVRNGVVVGVSALCVTFAHAAGQHSSHPINVTSPAAHYAAGTVVAQPVAGYVAAPPHGRLEPYAVRELRWDA